MILCLSCRRFWPKGSMYCGNCGKSLGKRFCPELHESHLLAKACTTCGSRKLSPGTRAISIRPLSWLLAVLLLFVAWNILLLPAMGYLWQRAVSLFWSVASPLISILINLAFWSFVLSIFVGDKGRAMISGFWSSGFRFMVKVLESTFKLVFSWLPQRKRDKPQP